MKQYTTARRVQPDIMRMIKLILSQAAKRKKSIRKFINKVREALDELEREL